MPERIQLKRTRGWRLPEGAAKVDRTTKWGNPFAVGETIGRDSPLWPYLTFPGSDGAPAALSVLDRIPLASVRIVSAEAAVEAYGWWFIEQPHLILNVQDDLGGHDLACWCQPGRPCHAQWLLDFLTELETPDA